MTDLIYALLMSDGGRCLWVYFVELLKGMEVNE